MYGFSSFYFLFFLFYFFYVLFFSLLYKKIAGNLKLVVMFFLPLFILSAFRGESVGGDLEKYIPAFHEICEAKTFESLISASSHEPGYVIFTKLIGMISTETRFFLIVTAFFCLLGPAYLIYKYSPNYIVSILMYYLLGCYTNTFNNIRQSLAVSVFFLGIPFLLNRKLWKYLIIVIIAISFHYSAIVLLLIYPIVKKDISFKRVLIFLIIGVSSYFIVGTNLIYQIVMLLFVKYNPDLIFERAGAGWNLLILYCIFFLLFFFIYKKNELFLTFEKRHLLSTLLHFQLIAIIFQLYATLYPTATRMGQYFFIPVLISVPCIFYLIKSQILKISFIVIFACYSLLSFYLTYSYSEETNSNSQGVIPYVFIN